MRKIIFNCIENLPNEVEESINRLRVNFGFCGEQYKKIIITSSTPNEGKSLISVNLLRMLGESGKSVILVDADLRNSVLRNRYMISSEDGSGILGLSHFLSGQIKLSDVVYKTNMTNAYILPTVNSVANAPLLLQNKKLPEMLDALAQKFDYVLVDTPPLMNVADAGVIASFCDGALLVVRSGTTSRRLIRSSMNEIARANCKLLGVVLNRVEKKNNPYYYGYSYGKYQYGYGKDKIKNNEK